MIEFIVDLNGCSLLDVHGWLFVNYYLLIIIGG